MKGCKHQILVKFQTIYNYYRTPFGEIPLESDIFDEGKQMKTEVLEKLERLYIPNIRIDHG